VRKVTTKRSHHAANNKTENSSTEVITSATRKRSKRVYAKTIRTLTQERNMATLLNKDPDLAVDLNYTLHIMEERQIRRRDLLRILPYKARWLRNILSAEPSLSLTKLCEGLMIVDEAISLFTLLRKAETDAQRA